MSNVGAVETLWRYPVKSMKGETVEDAVVTEGGLVGDRAYALIDGETGKIASAKLPRKWGGLVELAAAFVTPPEADAPAPPVRITWPDGATLVSGDEDPSARLSETIGRRVTLATTRPDEMSLERLDPLVAEETILDIGEIMLEGRFADYAPVHLLTTATLARLAELGPDSVFDARRFRPNVVIETSESGFVENAWVGRTVAIGDALRLRITDPTPRCAIPTLGHGSLPKDPAVLRTIVEHNRLPVPLLDDELLPCAGVYGFVTQPGRIRRGDIVRVETD